MNRDRVLLAGYLAAVVAATSIHRVEWLAAAVVVVLALAGRDAGRVVRRAAVAVAAFTGVVTLTYAVLAAWWGASSPPLSSPRCVACTRPWRSSPRVGCR